MSDYPTTDPQGREKGVKRMQQEGIILLLLSIVTFFSLPICLLAYGAGFRLEDTRSTVVLAPAHELIKGKYDLCQETERWKKLTDPNFPLKVVDWQIAINPGSSDRYMDKHIIGSVKNESERGFSEVKIEYTVFDEEGNQIGIVFSNFYELKPRGIWKFEIPVTSDVGKAELNGLYIRLQEYKA